MRQRLIDSILNGFDIPKVYLADFTLGPNSLNKRKTLYAIIDGRQRLETLFDFLAGKLSLSDDFAYYPDTKLDLRGLTFAQLRRRYPDIALDFENYNLGVMSVLTNDAALINELFVRLNSSRPLTGAEIRNAMAGEVPEVVRDIAAHDFFETRIRFKTNRGQDKNSAAKLLLTEFSGDFVSTKRTDLDLFAEEFAAEGELAETSDLDAAEKKVRSVLTNMCRVFVESDPILRSEGALPVYYWLVRNHYRPKHGREIRDFLDGFTSTRKFPKFPKREMLLQDLIRYKDYKRNANDAGSLRGRYEILSKWLELYENDETVRDAFL